MYVSPSCSGDINAMFVLAVIFLSEISSPICMSLNILCETCPLSEIIRICCRAHPETGESKLLVMDDGKYREVCIYMTESGECGAYENRPGKCAEYVCPKFNEVDMYNSIQGISEERAIEIHDLYSNLSTEELDDTSYYSSD